MKLILFNEAIWEPSADDGYFNARAVELTSERIFRKIRIRQNNTSQEHMESCSISTFGLSMIIIFVFLLSRYLRLQES